MPLQRLANGRCTRLAHTDIGRGHLDRRAIRRRERAFVAQEFDNRTAVINQRQPVRRSVLQSVRRKIDGDEAEPCAAVHNRQPGQIDRIVALAIAPVVEHDRPAHQIDVVAHCDFDELAHIAASIVIVKFVDKRAHLISSLRRF